MIIGNQANFAVDWEYVERIDDWLYGRFGLWACGVFIGSDEEEDDGVVLKGCFNWLRNIDYEGRFEPELDKMTADEVFQCLTLGVITPDGTEKFPNSYSRFHVSHIGMSSFDLTILLLLKTSNGSDRLIWQQQEEVIRECLLPPGTVEGVFRSAVSSWKEELANIEISE